MKIKKLNGKPKALSRVGLQRLVRRLRRALREVRDNTDPHIDEYDNEIPQELECFCGRCIAVRALSPNDKAKPRG